MLILQNPQGLYLNTGGRYNSPEWQEKPRVYKTKSGIRAALGQRCYRDCPNWQALFPEGFIAKRPTIPADTNGPDYTKWWDENRAAHREWWREFHKHNARITTERLFAALEKDGYVIRSIEYVLKEKQNA